MNIYQIIAPVMVGISILIGWNQLMLTPKLKIRRLYSDGVYKLIAVISGIVFAILLSIESWRGIFQLLDKIFGDGSGLWALLSLIAMPLTIAVATGMYAALVYYAAKIAAWSRAGYLRDKKQAIIRLQKLKEADELLREIQWQFLLETELQFQEETKRQVAEEAAEEARKVDELKLPMAPVIPFRRKAI